jgi:broad specificity phosphatase PhoE
MVDAMTRLTLVRHARPGASWAEALDPGLGTEGRAQAEQVAATIGAGVVRPVVTSPMRRARETAAPLAAAWGIDAEVRPAVGEIPSPPDLDKQARARWLGETIAGTWDGTDDAIRAWRIELLDALTAFDTDVVVVTHFVAINVAVGAARQDDRVISCAPDLASVTELDAHDGTLTLVALGHEARTEIR